MQDQDHSEQNTAVPSGPSKVNSRLIIKNIPKHYTEEKMKEHFAKSGEFTVTDAKIMRRGAKTRQFGFVGFKNEQHAKKALKYFNSTYIDTSKIEVDYAKSQNDQSLPRAWSKYSVGSSAYAMTHKEGDNLNKRAQKQASKEAMEATEIKKQRFREFLNLMGSSKDEKKQSWNDGFQEYMDKGKAYVNKNKRNEGKTYAEIMEMENAEKKASEPIVDKPKPVEGEEKKEGEEATAPAIENQRLYVMNLSYQITHDELKDHFGKYGDIDNIEIPLRKGGGGVALGIAYISFKETEGAISAYATMDKTYYQGRKLHILPAQQKPAAEPIVETTFEEREARREAKRIAAGGKPRDPNDPKVDKSQSDFKAEKAKVLKTNFDDETNWNYLFMNQDTVATSMAKRLGIQKSDLFDKDQSNMAVNLAKSEAIIINQTKDWMKEQGIDLDQLENVSRSACKRSETILLVKNIPYSTKEQELHEIFGRYGELARVLISPFNTIAIVEFANAKNAKTAAKNLAYYKVNYIMPIYLEFAPEGIIGVPDKQESSAEESGDEDKESREKTVFIKNLNFTTTENQIEEIFNGANLKGKVLSVKIVRNKDNQQSKGYGFVEMETGESAKRAIKKLQNHMHDEHAFKLSLAQKSMSISEAEQKKKKDKLLGKRKNQNELSIAGNESAKSNKLLVKNLAFEATPDDVRELFKQYGALKKVRLPKKVNSTNHRGFGFVEFISPDEALAAFKALQNSHLYSRRLVIEWSQQDSVDASADKQ